MDAKQRIELGKMNLKKAEQAQTVAATQKEAAEKQLAEVVTEMEKEGVTPETIQQEIAQTEAARDMALDKFEQLLPKV